MPMPEQWPDITADAGFQEDAKLWAQSQLRNRTIRVNEFEQQLEDLICRAYLQGGAIGYRSGRLVERNQKQNR